MEMQIQALLESIDRLCQTYCQSSSALNKNKSVAYFQSIFALSDGLVALDPPPNVPTEKAADQVVIDALVSAIGKVIDPLGKGYKEASEKSIAVTAKGFARLESALSAEHTYYQSKQGLVDAMKSPERLAQLNRILAHLQ